MKKQLYLLIVSLFFLSACALEFNPPPLKTNGGTDITQTAPPNIVQPTLTPIQDIFSLDMLDDNNGWGVRMNGHWLKTTDGGQTWIDQTPVSDQVNLGNEFFLDPQNAWFSAYLPNLSASGIVRTQDGGATWTVTPYTPGEMGMPHFTDAKNGWLESDGVGAGNRYVQIYSTQDGGQTWTLVPMKPTNDETSLPPGTIHLCNICSDMFYFDPLRVIIVGGDMGTMQATGNVRLTLSFDQGATWQKQNLSLPQDQTARLVDPSSGIQFIGSDGFLPISLIDPSNFDDRKFILYVTHDGGQTWSLMPPVLDSVRAFMKAEVVSSQDIFVICGNALCATHDGGQSWSTMVSNLDFGTTDTRYVSSLDFVNAKNGWAVISENQIMRIYRTRDGGLLWSPLSAGLIDSALAQVTFLTVAPPSTPTDLPTLEPTQASLPIFDQIANAYRITFDLYGTWTQFDDSINVGDQKRYVISAMKDQMMSVSTLPDQGALWAFNVDVRGADGTILQDFDSFQAGFWRGKLPSTQDYYITIKPIAEVRGMQMRVAVNPPGTTTQNFEFVDPAIKVGFSYTDEFAPSNIPLGVLFKGANVLSLRWIDSSGLYPATNLMEAFYIFDATDDPAVAASCLQPVAPNESMIEQVMINGVPFMHSEASDAGVGNYYEQNIYRANFNNACYEIIFFVHYTNFSNYTPGTIQEFDRDMLNRKFMSVFSMLMIK